MKQRCYDTNADNYPRYGGRGITVCDEWKHDFWMFVYHMGPKPSSTHTLDRVNSDYLYSPENCRWATPSEQNYNRRGFTKSGSKGYQQRKNGRFTVRIWMDGKTNTIGTFDTEAEATAAYQEALAEKRSNQPQLVQ